MRTVDLFKRQLFNKYRDIKSSMVSLRSIAGQDVSVMPYTSIDQASSIGSYTYVGYFCFITKSKIGRYVSIANNVSIGMGEHKMDKISTSSIFYVNPYQVLTENDCIIGNDVWIGVDSIIRRGVTIGDGAVIGANSYVNADIPDFAIAVGSPARILRYRFDERGMAMIKASKWWEFNLQEAKNIIIDLTAKLNL